MLEQHTIYEPQSRVKHFCDIQSWLRKGVCGMCLGSSSVLKAITACLKVMLEHTVWLLASICVSCPVVIC